MEHDQTNEEQTNHYFNEHTQSLALTLGSRGSFT